MQLKIRRSQKTGLTGTPIFALDVMAELNDEELALAKKYGLRKMRVYSTEAAGENADRARGGSLGALGAMVMDKVTKRLWSMGDLINGQHIECKDLNEVLSTEGQVREACQNIRTYLDTALAFNGGEEIVEFEAA